MKISNGNETVLDFKVMVICGEKAEYKLTFTGTEPCIYKIHVKYRDEVVGGAVSADINEALEIYRFILDGKVTPTTFYDIMEDILY